MSAPWSAIAQMLKGSLTPEMIKGLNIKGNLLEELIQKKLVLQEARSLGLDRDRRRSRRSSCQSAGISSRRPV